MTQLPGILDRLSIPRAVARGGRLDVQSTIDGNVIAAVAYDDPQSVSQKAEEAETVNYSSDLPHAQGIEFGTEGTGAGRMS